MKALPETEKGLPKPADDLEAVRTITAALADFSPKDQERIIRWAREKLGLAPGPPVQSETPTGSLATPHTPQKAGMVTAGGPLAGGTKDLKTFVAEKNPKSDVQFAATVAYFYRFEAPQNHRKEEIDGTLLQDATRLAGRNRLKNPRKTLNNAKSLGLVDSGSEPGRFTINTVGENLVAMTLPGQSGGAARTKKTKWRRGSSGKPMGK